MMISLSIKGSKVKILYALDEKKEKTITGIILDKIELSEVVNLLVLKTSKSIIGIPMNLILFVEFLDIEKDCIRKDDIMVG